jgi:hypothetical protein
MASTYTHKCNFTDVRKNSMAFPVPVFMKLTDVQQKNDLISNFPHPEA